LEDQLHGGKKCGHLAGKVLVPFQEHINRLIATRLQWDIMGVSNIIMARTDSESGKLLSSNIDIRDHEYILGVEDVKTNHVKAQSQLLYELESNGASADEINAAELEWTKSHPLTTFAQGSFLFRHALIGQLSRIRLVRVRSFPLSPRLSMESHLKICVN
jgi:isocitrate lyase